MLVLWLEENILKIYEPDKRSGLQNIDSDEWDTAFKDYCVSSSNPITSTETIDHLEWFLGRAVRTVYNEQRSKFDSETKTTLEIDSNVPTIIPSDNPIDNIDAYSDDFKKGVEKLADLLNISKHPDHIITLEAVSAFIEKRLSAKAINNPSAVLPKGEAFPLEQIKGHKIDSKDKAVLKALKVLRLAQLHRLRDLQTCINECIVSMQQITSNPKTDTKLGKVGY
ncbi:RNA transcription, translation and transport factor protein isoform X2 [Sipha flava]|nr:RNA transcription, translation and transport factor protein isoform X2 [Sipha flava]